MKDLCVVTTYTAWQGYDGGALKVWDGETGQLHCELDGSANEVTALATFLSPDGQQLRLVVGSQSGQLRVYGPEAGSVLHCFDSHTDRITDLACIASSSAAPHHPRLVSVSSDGTAKVWDGETGERLADLGGYGGWRGSVAVWKEHAGGGEHDRITTATYGGEIKVWDGKALTLLHDLQAGSQPMDRLLAFTSAGGQYRLLVRSNEDRGLQVWDPEEGRRLHHGINRGCTLDDLHLFESAQGRHLLAVVRAADYFPPYPGDTRGVFLDVWDLGEAPAAEVRMRPANKHG
jgi:WD40 repeat protein